MKTLREAYGAETKFTQSLAKDIDSLNKINELVGLPNVARAVNELSIPGGSIDVVGYTVKGEAIVYEHQDLSGRADQTHVGKTSHYARVLKSQGLKVLGTILLCESIDKIFLDTFEDIRWAYNRRPTLMGHCNIHAVRSIWTDELTYAPELFTDDTIIRGSDTVLDFYKQEIENKISDNNILISAHGNSIRALCKYLFKLDENQISKLEIPTGNPLLINLDEEKKITDCKYLDSERAKDLVVF
jgi:hypothetical protein